MEEKIKIEIEENAPTLSQEETLNSEIISSKIIALEEKFQEEE